MPLLPNSPRSGMVRCALVLLAIAVHPSASGQHDCQSAKHGHHHARGTAKGGGLALWPWDILHQRITLDLTLGSVIRGACAISAVPRENGLSTVPLQLLALTVDSVVMDDTLLPFTHSGIDLTAQLPQAFTTDDTITFTVHYSGDPALDPSGFGGFYTTGTYLYNLGVAFTSVPHSYGRAWFPCADNFTERSSYEFIVSTSAPYTAWCNGELLSETQPTPTTITRHWRLDESIPSYLASVSAANYAVVRDTLTSITSEGIPVTLVARPTDTTAMKNSFINLQGAFDRFEQWFGPYRWNRVGYVLTPQGAMEHATSIHYPQTIANGSLSYQDVMAHELAHHWFGNLVTCERAEEMYLNEGFAEYLAYLFIEEVNGASAYMNTVRLNHRRMLQRAHLDDGGWWALSEMPQEWTYGEHTYNKGADVLHTLRSYMGDSLFRTGLTSFLDAYEFEHVNTEMLRDHLNQVTGLDLTDYFTDWLQQPGWAAFEVEAFDWTDLGNGTSTVSVTVQQKHRGPADHYHNVPMSVSFVQPDGALWTLPEPVLLGGELTTFSATVPFIPHGVFLNADERISQAVTFDMETFSGPATRQYTNSDMRLTVNSTPAPFTIQVEEYWVAADDEVEEAFAYVVSPDRYWRITAADLPSDASLSGRFTYDGRPAPAIAFDSGLMQDFGGLPFREDSLVMLYREGPDWPWILHPNQTLTALGSLTDRQGRIDINDLRPGEYCFAWRKSAVGISEISAESIAWTLMPNPAEDFVIARADRPVHGVIELLDSRGRLVRWEPINGEQARIEVQGVKRGAYHLRFVSTLDTREKAGKLVIE